MKVDKRAIIMAAISAAAAISIFVVPASKQNHATATAAFCAIVSALYIRRINKG